MTMRKLVGPHLGGSWISKLDVLHKWQPSLILVLQPEVDKVKQLRDAFPQAIIIGRFYHEDSYYSDSIKNRPKDFAREIHQEIVGNPVTPLLDYAQSNNETNQDWEGIQKLNQFTQEWMALADQSQVYKCAILAFSVGNPDLPDKPGDPAGFDGKMLYWQQVLPSLNYAQANHHILLLHAYGYPDMFHPDADWYIYRYERQVQANLKTLGITNLKYAYGEIGIDRLIVNGKGGYKVVTNDQDYTNQLLQWEKDLQTQDLLLGGAIFTFGDSGGWDTYDISSTNVASMIATHYTDHAGDYSPDTEKEPMETHLPFVGTGTTLTPTSPPPPIYWDERLDKRGIKLTQYQPKSGEWYWRITRGEYWEEKEHIFAVTLDEQGNRKPDVNVRFWWQDGETDKRTEIKPADRWMVDFDMHAHSCSYGFKVLDGPSDSVYCMGLGSWQQPDWNIHVSYHYTVRWTQAPMTTEQPSAPTQLTAYVAVKDGANIRDKPVDGNILIAVPYREAVSVVDYNADKSWAMVRYKDVLGAMKASLLSFTPIAEPEPTPEQPPATGDNWSRSLAFTNGWEGGFQDHDWDAGNWTGCKQGEGVKKGTKFGISACSYPSLDIKNITREQATAIYFKDYWQKSGADKLPWPACLMVYDAAVNFGTDIAAGWWAQSAGNLLKYVGLRLRGYRKSTAWPQAGDAWVDRVIDIIMEAVK